MPYYDGYNTSFSDFVHAVYEIIETVPHGCYDDFMDILRDHIHGLAKEIIECHEYQDHVELFELLGEYFGPTEDKIIRDGH